jgi:hypothetical protein
MEVVSMRVRRLARGVHFAVLTASLVAALAPSLRADDDVPTIAKDSVRVEAARGGSDDLWKPAISFRVNGPIASGSQLYVEFSYPANKAWVKMDCDTSETPKGQWWKIGGCTPPTNKATAYVGPVDFTISLRNELLGTNLKLFSGKAKFGKFMRAGRYPEFYVDEDWKLPIGYVWSGGDIGHDGTFLHVGFWYRGNPADAEAHLFYKGKDIAKYHNSGNGEGDYDASLRQWGFVDAMFLGVYPGEIPSDGYDPNFSLAKNPGEYEVKVLIVNKLARSIKFTVAADGSFDNGIATANKLGSDRTIVPVQIIGTREPFDRLAWKTGAFYGNPLTGFTAAATPDAGK